MISSIKYFFSQFIDGGIQQSAAEKARSLQIATAVLLLEMMRTDRQIAPEERASIVATLREQFGLEAAQLDQLLELAEEEARQATSYYPFTSLINKHCSRDEKNRIIENLWYVAMCDGHIDAHENHLMRKIADLLYVGHADYIAAKQRARLSAGLPQS